VKFDDLIQLVGENLLAHRLRALLTILGITIGIAAVIAVVAIGQGGRVAIISEIETLGSSRYFEVMVDAARGEAPTVGTFRLEDANLIREMSPAVEKMAPISIAAIVDMRLPQARQKPVQASVIGTTPDYQDAGNLKVVSGRFLSSADVSSHARVAVLDASLSELLFGDDDPVGKRVFIQNTPATVIGLLEKQSGFLSMINQRYAYVPLTFCQEITNNKVIYQLSGTAVSKDALPQAMADSVKILNKRHFGSTVHYTAQSMEDALGAISQVTSVITTIIGAVAAIALVVGGVGVMNIMLVAVTERTREIGLLKALGARRRDIMNQFLGEAIALCLVGGFLGVLFGAGGAWIVAYFAHWPPLVSGWTILLAFGFSAMVGLFFGLYPASRAADLSPAEALRHL
jgi:putative ABC transport system permease protein